MLPPISGHHRWRLYVVTAISCARLFGAPIFIALFVSPSRAEELASVPFLAVLLATDVVDGFLARRWGVVSNMGYVLDGVADRSTHLALVVALTATRRITPVLAFVLLFRDLLLYAARALFSHWWRANRGFRRHVRITAVMFKLTVGCIALLSYETRISPAFLQPSAIAASYSVLILTTWLFAIWTYILLALQIRAYATADDDSPGPTL